jgi:hypothetical protein
MSLRIVTNNVPRETIDAWELSADERAEFDYHDWPAIERGEDSATFVRYRGELLDLADFVTTGELLTFGDLAPLRGWHGYASDSYFSGTVVRYVHDHGDDRVVVGRYYS